MSISTAVACTVFAFFHGWKLTLVVLSFVPFLIVANAIKMKVIVGTSISGGGEDPHLKSGKVSKALFYAVLFARSYRCDWIPRQIGPYIIIQPGWEASSS